MTRGGNCVMGGTQHLQSQTYLSTPDWIKMPQPLWNDPDWSENWSPSPYRGWASFQNTDAGNYTDDIAQGAVFVAPAKIGNKQGLFGYSALLNNVTPDSSEYYLLQNGLLFRRGKGAVIWSDTGMEYQRQLYNIPYVKNHRYFAGIAYWSRVWQICMGDNDVPGTYQCIFRYGAPGTSLKSDRGTSIAVENSNSSSKWYSGFSNPWVVSNAAIYRADNVAQPWQSQSRTTQHACQTSWPPYNAIKGSLIGGNMGYFYLEGVPLFC